MRYLWVLLVIVFSTSGLTGQEVNFLQAEWDEVLKQADEKDKFILVDAYTDWCHWCKVMDKETFKDPEVAPFINEQFVSWKVNAEKGFGQDFAAKFRITGYPTLLFFNPSGQLVDKLVGYMQDNDKFTDELKRILSVEDDQPYVYDSKDFDPGFPEFYRKMFDPQARKGMKRPTENQIDSFLNTQDDLFSEVSWSVMYRFPLSDKYKEHFFDHYDKYKERFGATESERMLSNLVFRDAMEAIKANDEQQLEQIFALLDELPEEKAESMKQSMRMRFYQQNEDWDGYFKLAKAQIEENGFENAGQVNSFAWNIYLHDDQPKHIKQAIKWMKKALKHDTSYAYVDTYAALLYKDGQYNKAEKQANRAIDLAAEEEVDVTETQELLEKIRKAKMEK